MYFLSKLTVITYYCHSYAIHLVSKLQQTPHQVEVDVREAYGKHSPVGNVCGMWDEQSILIASLHLHHMLHLPIYLREKTFPDGCSETRKRVIRKRQIYSAESCRITQ